jgi:hypothetical protein
MLTQLNEADIDMTLISEEFDETMFNEIIACAGGACEIK